MWLWIHFGCQGHWMHLVSDLQRTWLQSHRTPHAGRAVAEVVVCNLPCPLYQRYCNKTPAKERSGLFVSAPTKEMLTFHGGQGVTFWAWFGSHRTQEVLVIANFACKTYCQLECSHSIARLAPSKVLRASLLRVLCELGLVHGVHKRWARWKCHAVAHTEPVWCESIEITAPPRTVGLQGGGGGGKQAFTNSTDVSIGPGAPMWKRKCWKTSDEILFSQKPSVVCAIMMSVLCMFPSLCDVQTPSIWANDTWQLYFLAASSRKSLSTCLYTSRVVLAYLLRGIFLLSNQLSLQYFITRGGSTSSV